MKDFRVQSIAYAVAFAFLSGCQPGAEDATPSDVASDGDNTVVPASTSAPDPAGPKKVALPAWPESGQAQVEIKDGKIAVVSNDASQIAVLQQLADRLGFRVSIGDIEPGSLSGTLVDANVHQAVSFILSDLPYATNYAIEPASGDHKLAEVQVGRFVEVEPSVVSVAERNEHPQDGSGAAERWYADNTGLSLQLADSDPQVRVTVLETLDPESDDIIVLDKIVASDPDAQVREAAIDQLYFVDSHAAIQIAQRALQDPDPNVVIAALNLAEAWHNPSLVPNIETLRHHSNAKVRVRATELVAMLENND